MSDSRQLADKTVTEASEAKFKVRIFKSDQNGQIKDFFYLHLLSLKDKTSSCVHQAVASIEGHDGSQRLVYYLFQFLHDFHQHWGFTSAQERF